MMGVGWNGEAFWMAKQDMLDCIAVLFCEMLQSMYMPVEHQRVEIGPPIAIRSWYGRPQASIWSTPPSTGTYTESRAPTHLYALRTTCEIEEETDIHHLMSPRHMNM